MRAFIAINLSENIRERLCRLMAGYYKEYPEINWVKIEHLHLTLKFLGEIDVSQLQKVKRVLTGICQNHHKFCLQFQGLGAFPNWQRPRVLWVGIEDSLPLVSLAGDISCSLPLGDSKVFHPHVTLARIKESSYRVGMVIQQTATQLPLVYGKQVVQKVDLMESILRPGGPVYKKILTIELD